MNYAIFILKQELKKVKNRMKIEAWTEWKMLLAGRIDELEKAIKKLNEVKQ